MEDTTEGTAHFKLEAVTADRDKWRKTVYRLEDRVSELEMDLRRLKESTLYCTRCGAAMRPPQ